jgi:AcrR family transcriptional regulator
VITADERRQQSEHCDRDHNRYADLEPCGGAVRIDGWQRALAGGSWGVLSRCHVCDRSKTRCLCQSTPCRHVAIYHAAVPKVWADTIDGHKVAVRQAVIRATAALVDERGIGALTMSAVAERAGIGRATLYKYFSGPDEVLIAWHNDSVERHVDALRSTAAEPDPWRRLRRLLETFVDLRGQQLGGEAMLLLHRSARVQHAAGTVRVLLADAISACVDTNAARSDVPAGELANFCIHALTAAREAGTKAERARLIAVTLDALRAPQPE